MKLMITKKFENGSTKDLYNLNNENIDDNKNMERQLNNNDLKIIRIKIIIIIQMLILMNLIIILKMIIILMILIIMIIRLLKI